MKIENLNPPKATQIVKEFTEHGQRFSISQIEEIGFDLFWDRKDELRTALEQLARVKQALDPAGLLNPGKLLAQQATSP